MFPWLNHSFLCLNRESTDARAHWLVLTFAGVNLSVFALAYWRKAIATANYFFSLHIGSGLHVSPSFAMFTILIYELNGFPIALWLNIGASRSRLTRGCSDAKACWAAGPRAAYSAGWSAAGSSSAPWLRRSLDGSPEKSGADKTKMNC